MSNIDKQTLRMRNYLDTALKSGVKLLHLSTDELKGLLDELEASQSENDRLAKTLIERNGEPVEGLVKRVAELEEIATDYGMKFQRAQDALKHQSLLHKSQLEAAEKRISELTEKPIGWTDEQELRDVEKLGCGYLFNANPITPHADPRRVILLYAAAAGKGEAL